jgi:hypothetical protein
VQADVKKGLHYEYEDQRSVKEGAVFKRGAKLSEASGRGWATDSKSFDDSKEISILLLRTVHL